MSDESVFLSILIIDDSEIKVVKIKEAITRAGHESLITLARDQNEARRKLHDEKYDLVILDMQLPVIWGETDPESQGGENILSDLFTMSEDYKMPTSIIALTEYEFLQNKIQDEYPDVAAIRFLPDSGKWSEALGRKIDSLLRAKKDDSKQIVYCEGKNALLLNSIGLNNVEFRGLEDCRAIFLAAKNEKTKYALRDKDFLTLNEVLRLEAEFDNYHILRYYCFENYLYHPDNLQSLIPGFDLDRYKNEIVAQKNEKLLNIIQDYKLARDGYLELNENGKRRKDKKSENEIIEALRNNAFEVFYPYFDMAGKKDAEGKKSFNKSCLSGCNFDKVALVQTDWFKSKFQSLLIIRNKPFYRSNRPGS